MFHLTEDRRRSVARRHRTRAFIGQRLGDCAAFANKSPHGAYRQAVHENLGLLHRQYHRGPKSLLAIFSKRIEGDHAAIAFISAYIAALADDM
jgi:hypothetical protein